MNPLDTAIAQIHDALKPLSVPERIAALLLVQREAAKPGRKRGAKKEPKS